ncbi:response regulator transcription factor [Hyphomicrobium sp.]|jgi:DNA-binding NarL/FixJ family response regulator|uniref:response regulator transcription factor n=1 Tax=Hyphomicrobium sp. TaxID=82 RepID=UPI002D085F72|nr:response regulator transcription factor [Hyphomicrobium sp.]HVZ05778.1 response regulator transcription factor [Hyphomicrobium sp.]
MKLLLVDDHVLVRQGVRRLLSAIPGVEIFEAATSYEALSVFRQQSPDVVVLDISLAGASGLELLKRFLIENPNAKVLMLSMHAEAIYAARAVQAGARGYISKGASAEELVTAVLRVAEGKRYVEREIATDLAMKQFSGDGDLLERLTMREIEILRLLGEGKSLSAIASTLGVAYKTVANACSLMKSKLAVERTADLIRMALEMRKT